MEEKPVVAARTPKGVELVEGKTIFWCSCGQSKNQPFCDGSHKGTSLKPITYTPEKSRTAYLCMCKHSQNKPFCDGFHSKLQD